VADIKVDRDVYAGINHWPPISGSTYRGPALWLLYDLVDTFALGFFLPARSIENRLENFREEALRSLFSGVEGFILYPNSGREWNAANKKWLGDQSSAFTSEQISEWRTAGAAIIGGCCGVGPGDIQELKRIIE
jgi:Homocysteine S-methyltransferase